MKRVLKIPHFWIILGIMTCGALLYYADQIPWIEDVVTGTPLALARYSTHRILSIIPVAYAALVFGFKGGATTAIFVSVALLPRVVFVSDQQGEAYAEIVAFLFIGLLVSWLIDRQTRAVSRLKRTEQELTESLETQRQQQQQLVSLYAISTMIYRTLDVHQIAESALSEALQVTKLDVGWIYLRDDATGDLVLSTHRGLSPEWVGKASRIKVGEHLDGQVAESGAPRVMKTVSPEHSMQLTGQEDVGSILVAPLRSRSGLEGTLGMAGLSSPHAADPGLDLLTAIGDEIGIAIGHARLHHIEQVFGQQLRFSEERYRGLFENASEAILVCSSSGRIISANRACEQLTGYGQDELCGMKIQELFAGVSQEMANQLLRHRLKGEAAEEPADFSLTTRSGKEAVVELNVSPLARGDEVIGLQVIAHDVTEERQLRQSMQYYITQITRAQEEERLRISRELHDDTAQILVSLSRGLDSLISLKPKLPKTALARLEKLRGTTELALEGVRRFSQDLRPSVLDDLGLVPALEWLTGGMEKQHGVATKFTVAGSQHRLTADKELVIFRIAQETLSNVRRHSQATAVSMSLDFAADALTLIISDNGRGFYLPQRASDLVLYGKLGVVGMRERARLVGGTIVIQSDIGCGTTVTLRVPE